MIDYGFWRQERARVLDLKEAHPEIGNYLAAIDVILERPYTVTYNNDGAAAREALVESLTNRLAANLNAQQRILIMGSVRVGAVEAAHEIAQTYPQLAKRIYASFGMSGWDDKTSL